MHALLRCQGADGTRTLSCVFFVVGWRRRGGYIPRTNHLGGLGSNALPNVARREGSMRVERAEEVRRRSKPHDDSFILLDMLILSVLVIGLAERLRRVIVFPLVLCLKPFPPFNILSFTI
eukprot:Hpha_TRINITY_DN16787_c2_g2::TRINITY_DN16787_c2_g2_i1::g.76117::m.76117